MDVEEIGIGGMKYVSFMVTGQGAYSKLKYESGVHRVQRVPETESGGRRVSYLRLFVLRWALFHKTPALEQNNLVMN